MPRTGRGTEPGQRDIPHHTTSDLAIKSGGRTRKGKCLEFGHLSSHATYLF